MKKLFPLIMLCLGLFACSKQDAEDTVPANEQSCVLQETAATSTTGSSGSKYTRDAAGKVLKLEFYEKGALARYHEFTYNSKNLIAEEAFFQADGSPLSVYTYAYSDADLLVQMESWQFINGTMQHTFTNLYDYASDKKIARRLMQHPDGRIMSAYLYEYEGDEMRRILTYNSTGQHTHTATLQYDDKKTALSNTPALHKAGWLMVGYPFSHNIISYTNTSTSGQVAPESYTTTYEYNPAGHPIKSTKTLANGSQSVVTLTYQCK